MTLQQSKQALIEFKQALIDMGYKVLPQSNDEHMRYKKHNKEVCVQDLYGINIFFDIKRKTYDLALNQHGVKDFAKALKNIKTFERKMGR